MNVFTAVVFVSVPVFYLLRTRKNKTKSVPPKKDVSFMSREDFLKHYEWLSKNLVETSQKGEK